MTRQNQNNQPDSTLAGSDLSRGTTWFLLGGIFLLSFSLLAFEITLARILSVVLLYHYVFLVVSLALLGLGSGGIFVHMFRSRVPLGDNRFGSLALFASLFALSIPVSVIIMTRIAYISSVTGGILLYCLLLLIPFFFAGVFLAEVFRMFPALTSRVYGADLVGAAVGSFGVVLILSILGDINSGFLYALITALSALLLVIRASRVKRQTILLPAFSFALVFILLVANLGGSFLPNMPVGRNPDKNIAQFMEIYHGTEGSFQAGEIAETRWSAFGRTDMVNPHDDFGFMVLFIDGTAGTPMYRFNGNLDSPNPEIASLKTDFVGYLPFLHLPDGEKDNALIIGPGGGRDVLLALMGGVAEITAVEVNRDLVDIVRHYQDYNGGIYSNRYNVTVNVDEGRNFLKRQDKKYDIIMLSLVVTQTSRSLEGFSLTENFLFTTDSIEDYIAHLTDEGRLMVLAHDPVEAMRVLSLIATTLEKMGIDNQAAMQQIYVVASEMYVVLVMKKTPLAPAEMQALSASIEKLDYIPSLAYLPTVKQDSYLSFVEALIPISEGNRTFRDLENALRENGVDLSPVTDNSPFFYKLDTGMPNQVTLVFWLSIAVLLVTIIVSLIFSRKRASYRGASRADRSRLNRNLLRFVLFFLMLGMGFMLVEISTIQRFILFLGQPVLSMAVLLFSLLVGAGIGSLYSNRFTPEKIMKMIAVAAASIVVVLVIYVFLIPVILEQVLGTALAVRLLVTFVLIAPLGFLMGFPFPLGLRLLQETRMEDYIPWMWGINGISSVLGSVLTLVIAINFGFTQALLAGAACYFIVFLIFQMTRSRIILAQEGGDSDG